MKKFLSLFVVSALILISSGCVFDKEAVEMSPESLMPQDMTLVLAVDHSNEGQIKLLQEVFNRIPSFGFVEDVMKDFEYKELLNSPWKIAFGVKLPKDDVGLKKIIENPVFEPGKNGLDVYIAGKFGMPELVNKLLDKMVADYPAKFEFVGTEEDPIWKVGESGGSVMIIRRGDLYFVAFTSDQRAEILKRMDEGDGFSQSENYQKNMKLLGDNLGYVYVNLSLLKGLAGYLEGEIDGGMGFDFSSLKSVGEIWGGLAVDKNGGKVISKMYFGPDKELVNKYYPDNKVSLVEKVPSKGVILYSEIPSLGLYLEGISTAFQSSSFGYQLKLGMADNDVFVEKVSKPVSRDKGYKSEPILDDTDVSNHSTLVAGDEPVSLISAVDDVEGSGLESLLMSDDLYGDVLSQIGAFVGLSAQEVKSIFDSPFAFAVSDSGGYLPAISLYLKVDEDSLENAKALVSGTAVYVDMIIEELNNELKQNQLDGIIKKEVKLVDGATLQRVYVDIASLSKEKQAEFNTMAGMDISTIKAELYYGVLNDGVLVFAFYPDFIDDYGNSPISDSDYYKEMKGFAGDIYGRSVVFFRMGPLLKMVDTYFELAKKIMGLDPELNQDIFLEYELYTKMASMLKYVFASDIKDSDGLRSGVFAGIQEVELSPELLQKIEALELEKKSAEDAMMKMYDEVGGGIM